MQKAAMNAYLELTKPGITLFIGISAAAGYVTAARGLGDPVDFVTATATTMLMSAGAAALNHYGEREGDARMRRTSRRPIPSGTISAHAAAKFGWSLSTLGLLLAVALLPFPAVVFLALSHISYVYLYTPLKRRTAFCTLAGAIPGALPVLAGWTATGQPVGPAAIALTGVLFMWQIPHFLAIGCMSRDDYARAGCVLLSIVEPTGRASARVSFAYAVAMMVCAGVLAIAADTGVLYTGIATVATAGYAGAAWRFANDAGRTEARRLFFSSLLVLPVVLCALMVDLLLLPL